MAADLFEVYEARNYVQRSSDPSYVEQILYEHSSIINIPIIGSCENFQLPVNRRKNRRPDFPCWDMTRVVLRSNPDSDYINASFIAGFDSSLKFIATQQPMPSTFDDFWNMVWQENSRVIVMLNGTKQVSEPNLQYFCANLDNTILRDFIIRNERIKLSSHYIKASLNVIYKQTGESRIIHHFRYLNWPETGLPDAKMFIDFLLAVNKKDQHYFKNVLQTNQPVPGPIVVHDDAGVGRTAAYCAADICLYQLVHTAYVSVPSIVFKVRLQRNYSFQNWNDYIFVHNVVLYFLVTMRSNIATFLEFRSHLTKNDVYLLLSH